MFEIADRLLARLETGEQVAVATISDVSGSAPRGLGTSMAVTRDGSVIGSISGGCVEGTVYELCQQVLDDGRPVVTRFGDDDDPFAPGLTCGGAVEVVVQRIGARDHAVVAALRRASAGLPVAVTRVMSGPRVGAFTSAPEDCGEARAVTERFVPRPHLVIVGAVEFAVALSNAASVLGHRVTVCDPRPVFATEDRFPAAQEVVVAWPSRWIETADIDERTAVVVLGHDDRYDAEVIATALVRGAGYVGAMGSRATSDRRLEHLRELGVHDTSRLHSPIGLDLGAETPEEVAVAVLAELLATRNGTDARPLRDRSGRIHARRGGH